MLHAFIRKGVHGIFPKGTNQTNKGRNEDAVTSMVFTPFVFMGPNEIRSCLSLLLGPIFDERIAGREVIGCSVHLWPAGLDTKSKNGERCRCEPDLVIRFTFAGGETLLVIGEMKWATYPSPKMLSDQIARQLEALSSHDYYKSSSYFTFSITQSYDVYAAEADSKITWKDAYQHLNIYCMKHDSCYDSITNWALLIKQFLFHARQISFQGFSRMEMDSIASVKHIFFYSNVPFFQGMSIDKPNGRCIFYRSTSDE